MKKLFFLFLSISISITSFSQQTNINNNKFKQLGQELPTPNVYRTASGAPGHKYWQQKADYKMNIRLDETEQRVYGTEVITYHNFSPDQLNYLWVQLDQNVRSLDSDTYKIRTGELKSKMTTKELSYLIPEFDGGFKIDHVKDLDGVDLSYTINKTMMRIDLPQDLNQGETYSFEIKWWYNINNRLELGGRSGYEYFEEDDNYLFTIAQFFPRVAVYNEVEGWQHKQFLGRGEFALPFGDYEVNINVPDDHMVASTGTLINPKDVLSDEEMKRLDKAKKEKIHPVIIVTEDEVKEKEKSKSKQTTTWTFKAENVRDFGFATSRKFIWDALAVDLPNGKTTMAMSMYPKEGNPLWEQYSTKSVAHALKWYSHYTIDYPYPVAWSVHTARIGMEYPMISFNGRRPEKDGTYSAMTKYRMISVIIHEVGHNFFPMIINSNERQWTWMDEGLNSFVQFLAEQEWERDYPSRRGEASKIVDYMKGDKSNIAPIMTNSESIHQFGNNAYGKPATALNILRETIMGRELFDFAFKEYCRRWKFKHPSPADFFRSMEDASSVDLDWFWRGWFYTTDHVDISIKNIKWFQLNSMNPTIEKEKLKKEIEASPKNLFSIRNAEKIKKTQDELDPTIKDFYSSFDPLAITNSDKENFNKYYNSISEKEKTIINAGYHFYEIEFENLGGLVMPIILKFNYKDGKQEIKRIPAEIWKINSETIKKVFVSKQEILSIELDPFIETADINRNNNYFPPKQESSRFELFKSKENSSLNEMQKAKQN